MELKNLQEHVRTLATLADTGAEVISCYLTLENGRLKSRNTFDEQVRSLKLGMTGKERSDFETALERIEAYLKTALLPDAKGIALFSRAGEEPFFGSPPKKLLSERAYVSGIARNRLNPLVFDELGPRGARPQTRPTSHPIGRRPLAGLGQGERRPTGSRAAGQNADCVVSHDGAEPYDLASSQ